MSTNHKDVELRIRARNESSKALDKLVEQIEELEAAQAKQQEAAKRGEVGTRELDASYNKLERTMRGLIGQDAAIRTFEAQSVAMEKARTRTNTLRDAQAALSRQIDAAARPTQRQTQSLTALTERLVQAERQEQRAASRLAATTDRLRAAGIATDKLADAQARIVAAVARGNAALERQAAASDKAAGSVQRHTRAASASSATLAAVGTRLQALAAGYLSLRTAINLAGEATNAFSKREGIRNQLALVVGNDPAAIAREYEYVAAQADRIGISFEAAAPSFAKFAASATKAGRSLDEVKFIFEAFAEVGRVANLTTEELDGVLKALEQIFSKGTIQAEELRGQLGDRLFGAFQVAAESLRDVFPDLNKALQDGAISADHLVTIAARYREMVADQLPTATQSLAAHQARLNNAVLDFKLAVADSGFADAYVKLLEDLTAFFKSDDGRQFAKDIGEGFAAVAKSLAFIARNAERVKRAFNVVTGRGALSIHQELRDRYQKARKETQDDIDELKKLEAGRPTPLPPPAPKPAGTTGPTEQEIKKRETLIESLRRQLEQLEASIDRNANRTLAEQLRAIDTQYAKLRRNIASLGESDSQAVAMAEELARLTGEKKLQVTREFNERLAGENDTLLRKLEQAEASAGKRDRDNLDARLEAIAKSYDATYRDIAAYQARLNELGQDEGPAQAMRERLDLAVQQLQLMERQKFAQEELIKLEQVFRDAVHQRDAQLAAVSARQDAGQINERTAVDQANAIREQYLPAIQEASAAVKAWAIENKAAFTTEGEQAAFIATIDAITVKATTATEAFTRLDAVIADTFVDSATQGITALGQSFAGLIEGTQSWSDSLRAAGAAARGMFASIVKGIAQTMIRQQMLNAILAISKALGWSGLGNAAISAGANVMHTGRVVGQPGPRRFVNPAWFENAPRLHGEGMPGLASNEYAAILKRNEEVLSESDPRNVLNGGASPAPAVPDIKIINAIDSGQFVSEGMNTREGQTAVKNLIQARRNEFRAILGIG